MVNAVVRLCVTRVSLTPTRLKQPVCAQAVQVVVVVQADAISSQLRDRKIGEKVRRSGGDCGSSRFPSPARLLSGYCCTTNPTRLPRFRDQRHDGDVVSVNAIVNTQQLLGAAQPSIPTFVSKSLHAGGTSCAPLQRKMGAPAKLVDKEKEGSWIKLFLIGLFVLLIFLNFPVPCQSHGHHDHAHDHHHHHQEPASFKYSKEANEAIKEKQAHDQHHGHHDHHHHHHHGQHDEEEKLQWRPESNFIEHDGDVFIQAMGSTLLISAAPFFILFLVPLDNSKEREPLLKVLLAFATGGLLGDAFLHLIPHALSHEHSHDHLHQESHSHEHGGHDHSHGMTVGLCILGGIITFMLVDVIIRQIKGGHSHHHHHEEPSENKKQIENKKKNADKKQDEDKEQNESEKKGDKKQKENKELSKTEEKTNDIKIAGYLNLAADFLHNFTDGLAIGASYLSGNNVGVLTTLTILLHEVPHEIGDFAILIQSGCSKQKAIMLQLITAVGALIGTYISLLVGGVGDLAARYVLPYTAGGFIYIATVSVIPELLNDVTFKQSVKQIIAMLVGVYMMVLVAEYE